MSKQQIVIVTSQRDRIERRVRNSILANTVRVCSGGIFEPSTSQDRADKIARLITEDLLKDYRLVPRK